MRSPPIRLLRQVAEANAPAWRQYPNVHHVGVARRTVGGEQGTELTIVFFVTEKKDMPPSSTLPKELVADCDGQQVRIVTDVQPVPGLPVSMGIHGGDTVQARDGDRGTATIVGQVKKGGPAYIFTCSHVLTNTATGEGRDEAVGWTNPSNGQVFHAGKTVYATPFAPNGKHNLDAGLVLLLSNMPSNGHVRIRGEAQEITRFDWLRTDQSGPFYYMTRHGRRECRSPVPIAEGVEVKFLGPNGTLEGTFLFEEVWSLSSANSGPSPGDSGALIYKRGNNGLVGYGVLFAGVPDKQVWAFPAPRFINFLKSVAPL